MDDPNSAPEVDKDFTRDVFDDTHLNMDLAITKSVNGPENAKVTRCLRDKNGLPRHWKIKTRSWTRECMRPSIQIGTKHH
jgi:hypothetical protein